MKTEFTLVMLLNALDIVASYPKREGTIVRVYDENRGVYGTLLTVQGEVCPDGSTSVTLVVDVDY